MAFSHSTPQVVHWVNVISSNNADNTGVTDATAAIQSALNRASTGQIVYFPPGTYLLSSNPTVPSGVYYYLENATLSGGTLSGGTQVAFATPGAVQVLNQGTNTSGSAPVITSLGSVSGTSIQLSDLTRDYMVYLEITTAGTATTVEIGHTSAASDVLIMSSGAVSTGVVSFRLPAGWWFKWTGTTTAIANQNAVGC